MKKDEELLAQWVPEISKGYIKTSNDEDKKAEKDIEAYIQIFIDSARYSFGYNHAVAYSMVGYLCAYLRYYYPVEFTTAFLRRSADETDVAKGTELAETLGITTEPITFGHSDAYYTCKGKSIYKGMESVKFINAVIPSELNELSNSKDFTELYTNIKDNTSVNSRQMNVLIKVDYFNRFGKQRKLLEYVDLYNLLFAKKSVKKDKLEKNGYGFLEDLIAKYSKETTTMYRFEDKASLVKEVFESIENEDFDEYTKIKNEAELLGYVKTMPSKEGITVGKIVAKSYTKPWVLFKSFRNGKELWLRTKCKPTQIPPKESIVVIGNIEVKNSRKGKTYWVDIELVK